MHDSDETGTDGAPWYARHSRYMRRYYLVAASSLMVLLLVGACAQAGVLAWRSGSQVAAMIVLVVVVFLFVFRTGLNMRCHDRSLTPAQMAAATLVVFYALYEAQSSTARLTLAVNVSAAQLRAPEFVALVEQELARGANPRLLKLELTESMLLNDVTAVTEKMAALEVSGVGFALDDFGTGYSSLAYQRLPLDQIKIDRSFMRDITGSASDRAIVRAIVNLAHSLGFAAMAEGVETPAQLVVLRELGCHAFQGYLVGEPVPVDAFVASLAAALPAQAGRIAAGCRGRTAAVARSRAIC